MFSVKIAWNQTEINVVSQLKYMSLFLLKQKVPRTGFFYESTAKFKENSSENWIFNLFFESY